MIVRRGMVFIAADTASDGMTVVFDGYWDSGERSVLEQMPMMDRAADAIRWGLARSDDVRIRFDGWDYFWAGVGPMPEFTGPGDDGFAGTVTMIE